MPKLETMLFLKTCVLLTYIHNNTEAAAKCKPRVRTRKQRTQTPPQPRLHAGDAGVRGAAAEATYL